MPQFDVLVAGEINPDLILSGKVLPEFGQVEKLVESAVLTVGSSSVIFACGAARLGLRVAFIGVCGDDVWGQFMLAAMQQRGVDVSQVLRRVGGTTGLSVILNRGSDRAILTHPGLTTTLEAAMIPTDLLRATRHLHVAAYFLQTALQAGLPALFERAHTLGVTTSLDTNYDPAEAWQGFDTLLAHTNVFLPNETEACSLARAATVEQAAEGLASKVETVAIKLGPAGALGAKGQRRARVPSLPVTVMDTVGAGDSFDAGFIYAYLHGWDLERALRLATICGALSTRAAGGTTAQPTLAEALEQL